MSITTGVYQYSSNPTRAKHAQIIAIVEQNPGITGAEIISRYYAADVINRGNRQRVRNMLVNLCCKHQLRYLEGDRYTIPPLPYSSPTNAP
jgi:hypothetical protein